MRVLNLSLDKTILEKDSATQKRLLALAEAAGSITVLVPASKTEHITLSPHVTVYSFGGPKVLQFFRMWKTAIQLTTNHQPPTTHFELITVQDPYFLGFLGAQLAKKFSLPLEVQVHGLEKFSGVRKWIARFVLGKAKKIRVVSNRLRYTLAKSYKLKANSLSVGIPRNFLEMEGIDADVLANFNAGIKKLQARGHTIVDITLPTIPHSLAVYYVVMPAELSTNLSRFDGVRYGFHKDTNTLLRDYAETRAEGFGMEARRRILLGAYVLSSGYYDAYYRKAIQVRTLIEREFAEAFKKVDLIATPTTATPAFKLDEKSKNPLSMYLTDIFTVPANIGAIPAISIPSGFVERDGKKLPLGFQLMAGYGNDWLLFEVGKQFTNECDSPL